MTLELRSLSKSFGDKTAVDRVSLTIPQGELMVLIGPSGCGKTTTLKMINRLVEPDSGSILADGEDITGLVPEELRRAMGYVIQQVGLFPHMTVEQNIAVVPRLLGWDRDRIRRRGEELLALVGLDPGEYAGKWPRTLSGGEAQRVGVARALAADPPVLLMDEPFGAVDPIAREGLQREFLSIQKRLGKTAIMVTHDLDEAILLGDRIAVMNQGRLVAAAPTEELLRHSDPFVRDFTGDDRALRRLGRFPVADYLETIGCRRDVGEENLPVLSSGASVRNALSKMLETGVFSLEIQDDHGGTLGVLCLDDILGEATGHCR